MIAWPARIPRPSIAAVAIAILAVLLIVQTVRIEGLKIWPLHIRGYKGKLEDIQNRIALDKAAQSERERQADMGLGTQKQRDAVAAERRKQEIEDATANLPDQAPTARQRARACVELRRQAKAQRRPEPAC